MKKIMILLMATISLNALATDLDGEAMSFEFEQKVVSINWSELLVDIELPPIEVNYPAPSCFGSARLCNMLTRMWEMGGPGIPAGCHRSGAVGSEVYYCEIQ
ncbi:hypothetical protein OS175_10710 [Marinicella sp. S1101]|uniref:hypothetical protein n=1 Tax=Marinicella marina TaxID=2996016 RepID=UPI002260C528|nr:hypothetical protein [Marinicella marina]MCX7554352.1 hypothetical protein [Marinicella marina]MDJ1138657.1 hypothetical protein [Marinicella marina]